MRAAPPCRPPVSALPSRCRGDLQFAELLQLQLELDNTWGRLRGLRKAFATITTACHGYTPTDMMSPWQASCPLDPDVLHFPLDLAPHDQWSPRSRSCWWMRTPRCRTRAETWVRTWVGGNHAGKPVQTLRSRGSMIRRAVPRTTKKVQGSGPEIRDRVSHLWRQARTLTAVPHMQSPLVVKSRELRSPSRCP